MSGAYGVLTGTAHPAVLIQDSKPQERFAAGGDAARLIESGHAVFVLEPRPAPAGAEGLKSPFLGPYNLLSLRAALVGKTIAGMRTDDAIRAGLAFHA